MSGRQIVLDTETTGLETAEEHRIVEIGCIELRDRRVVGERRWYLNPDRESDAAAFEVHGLSREFLADKPRFPEVAAELVEILRDAEVLIHNAAFDCGFLDAEFARAGLPSRMESLCRVTDTWELARRMSPGQKNGLDALCKRYGVDNSQRELHGALLDARLLADVYLAMTGGQSALLLQAPDDSADGGSPELRELFAEAAGLALVVVRAVEAELAAHQDRLKLIAKKAKAVLWLQEPAA